MPVPLLYCAGSTDAIHHAVSYLSDCNMPITYSPSGQVTHLLLDVPSFADDGRLRNGSDAETLLDLLPKSISIIGGNLNHRVLKGYQKYDLLTMEDYLYKNAFITAHCAMRIALQHLKCLLSEASALIIGWGRIGKCLSKMLQQNGCDTWLSIRNPKEIALAQALGYHAIFPSQELPCPDDLKLIFNTVPCSIYKRQHLSKFRQSIKIDLASVHGLEGDDVITARGLPGKFAPESSGKLIAQTIQDLLKGE